METRDHRFNVLELIVAKFESVGSRRFSYMNGQCDSYICRRHQFHFAKFCFALLIMTGWISTQGATVTWVGGSGDWDMATNWSSGAEPGPDDDVVIGSGPTITVTHSTGADTVNSILSQQALVVSGGSLTVSSTIQVNNTFTLSGGTIAIATILQGTNGAGLIVSGGTLDGVTVNGVLDVGNSYNRAQLTVTNGLVLNGTALVGNPTNGWSAVLQFLGSQTLSGSGTVVFGNGCNALAEGSGSTLTIGAGITVRGQNGYIGWEPCFWGVPNVSVINQGTISADVANGTITIAGQPFSNQGLAEGINGGTLALIDTWNNSGTLVESGGALNLGGNFTLTNIGTLNQTNGTIYVSGTLTNTGTLTLNTNNIWVLNGGTILGGTVAVSNGISFIVQSGTLNGVTVNGVLDVGNSYNGAQLTVTNGLVLNGTALVGNPTNGWSAALRFLGSQTLSGSGAVVFGNGCEALAEGSGSTLTIGAGITVRGQNGYIGWEPCFWGVPNVSVINQGTISADVANGTIYVYAQPFSNLGTLAMPSGAITLAGSNILSGGTVSFGINGLGNYGQMNITGSIQLGGTLSSTLNNGFLPVPGNSFQLITYPSFTGSFNNTNLPPAPGEFWQTTYGATALTITAEEILTPIITWTNPAPINYGTPLSSNQLNATANVLGSFTYNPPSGSVLNVGTNTLCVIFTPTDTNDYNSVTDCVSLVVMQVGGFDVVADFSTNANPNGVWSYGWATAVGEPFQLLATSFQYPDIAVVGWGNGLSEPDFCVIDNDFSSNSMQWLTVVFDPDTLHMDPQSYAVMARFTAPSDAGYQVSGLFRIQDTLSHAHDLTILANGVTTNYYDFTSGGSYNSEYPFNFSTVLTQGETMDFVVSCHNGDYYNLGTGLKVTITNFSQATPVITWTNPAPIPYGTPLSSKQLNATANVSGSFAYNPPSGSVLNVGTNTLCVIFTPTDTNDYNGVTDCVNLVVLPVCVPPPSGLVSWWPGNGNALDIVSGNNGTPINVSYAPGEVGTGFSFTGLDSAVLLGNPTNLQLQNFTIEAWIQRGSTSIVTEDPNAGAGAAVFFGYGSGGYAFAIYPDGTPFLTQADVSHVSATTGVTDTNWHHLAVTTTGGTVVFYIDGVAYPAGTYNPSYQFTTPAAIGARGDNAANGFVGQVNTFLGMIDELSIYNRALSSNEIASIYDAGGAGKCAGELPPVIVEQPTNQLVLAGSNAQFSVVVIGSQPLFYQWLFNGSNLTDNAKIIGSQSNVLTLTCVTMTNSGTYQVIVTNAYGSVTSAVVTLTVSSPTVQFTASPTNGTAPLTVQFTSPSIDSQGNAITQWNWNFGDGSTSTLQSPSHIYATAGSFNPSLIATNNNGFEVLGSGPSIGVNGYETPFYYSVNGGAITITGYNGAGGAVAIPNTINGLAVTTIGTNAFYQCTNLTSVTIPNSVTNIEDYAFYNCFSLTNVTIPGSVTDIGDWAFAYTSLSSITIGTNVNNIGDYAFFGCGLTSVTIPNSVTSIGEEAFWHCGLTNVTIGSGVTSIGDGAFGDCNSLTGITVSASNTAFMSVAGVLFNQSQTTLIDYPEGKAGTSYTIPNTVSNIGDYAFYSCGLTNVTIGTNVTSIGDYAFYGCGLINVMIGSNVTNIGDYAFYGCFGLTNVTIPGSVTSIGDGAFGGCFGLTAITVNTNNLAYISVNGVLFNKTQTTLIQYPEGKAGTSYTIPNSVANVGDYAFYNCDLTSVTIPNSVTNIGNFVFEFCFWLTNVTIGNSVTSIGVQAFWNCGLTNVTIGSGVTNIGLVAFGGCFGLTAITVNTNNLAYISVNGVLFNKTQTTLIQCPGAKFGSYSVPNSVTSIGEQAFAGCENLTSVTIPGSVTNIGFGAFAFCYSLTSVTILGSVTSIGPEAFILCGSLTSIYFGLVSRICG